MTRSFSSGSRFNFPLSGVIPAIGTGFDVIGGQPMNQAAFEPPMPTDLDAEESNVHQSKYFSIYDASSLENVTKFEMESSGGGWGASEGMTVSASARIETTATCFTVHFVGVSTSLQHTLKSDFPLSETARKVLKTGIGNFIDKYGTHFVAGYIYGRLCRLSYNMKFNSVEAQIAFKAKYDESATELDFSETTEASLKNTLTTSNTTCSIDVEANCRGYHTISPGSFKDLMTAKSDFDKPPGDREDPTAISIIVMPWYYLHEVSSASGLALNDLQQLTPLLNKWSYVRRTCQKFIDDSLYTGHTQLNALREVAGEADAARSKLLKILTEANKKGSSLDVHQGDANHVIVEQTSFAYPDQMISDMNFALQNFVLSFSVATSNGQTVGCKRNDLKGNPIPAVNEAGRNVVNGQMGSYFNWSLVGQDEWEGTRGTQSNWTDLAWVTIENNRARLVLNREKGTVQCWFCLAGDTLAHNAANEPTPIRGKATSQSCDDPANRDRISVQFGALSINVSPM